MVFYLSVLLIAVMCDYVSKHKLNKAKLTLIFIFLLILMAANMNNPDYANYRRGFYTQDFRESTEWGYVLLTRFFYSLGCSYSQFRLITSAIGLILINCTVRKYLKYSSPYYLLYFLYPFMMDIVQVRNFLAMSIFIFSVPWLISDKKYDWIKYCIAVIIASLMQKTALVYIPIVLFRNTQNSKLLKNILMVSIILSIACGLSRSMLNKLSVILMNVLVNEGDSRLEGYATIQTRYGYLLHWAFQAADFIFIWWADRIARMSEDHNVKMRASSRKFVTMVYWINAYAFLFMPLYVFQSTFTRFMRNIVPLNEIACLSVFSETKGVFKQKLNYERLLFICAFVAYTVVLFQMNLNGTYHDSIVKQVFESNWIFNWDISYWLK